MDARTSRMESPDFVTLFCKGWEWGMTRVE